MSRIRSALSAVWSALRGIRHHLFSAIVVVSGLLILEHYGLTNWLDSLALRIAIATKGPGVLSQIEPSNLAGDREASVPLVVSITSGLYETGFRQESPLDRELLAKLLDNLRRFRPAAIVIDLDLSPTPGSAGAKQERLDSALEALIRAGIRVTAATPFPVVTESTLAQKSRWLADLCASGVRFGYPDLLVSQGVVLRIDPTFPSIAVVAVDTGSAPAAELNAEYEPCRLAAAGKERAVFLSAAFSAEQIIPAAKFAAQLPINSDYLSQRDAFDIPIWDIGQTAGFERVTGRVVFVGGQYDPADSLKSAVGEVPGVWLHAAGYQTLMHPPKRSLHFLAIAFDVILGVVSGLVFSFGWARFNRHSRALVERTGGQVGHYLASKGWLIVNFAVLILVIAMIFVVSAWLLQRNLWNNPAGMLLGVFVDAQLGSRADAIVAAGGGGHHGHDSAFSKESIDWPAVINWILLLPLVGWAAFLLVQGH